MARAPPAQESARDGPYGRAESLDARGADDGDRHTREALGQDDVVLPRLDDRRAIGIVHAAFGGGDEARPHLHAGISALQGLDQVRGAADAAGAHQRHAELCEFVV